MKFKLQAYSIWEFGKRVDANGNPHQEDSIYPAHGQQRDSDRLFVLCDGMGGHDAGEVASATVCEAMSRSVMSSVPDAEALFTDDMLQKAVADAFDALDRHDSGAVKKMGTTMTFLKLHAGGATIAHMGDSRVYHIRPGKDAADTQILFCTEDHSLVNDLVKVGELTPEEARTSPQKNIITRAMQPHMDRRPHADVKHITDIRPGDYFYMCSDGMLEQMEDDNIRFNFSAMTGDDANKVNILTNATYYNRDNHTAFIIHILDVEGAPAAMPTAQHTQAAQAAEMTAMTPPPADSTQDPDDPFVVEPEDGDDEQPQFAERTAPLTGAAHTGLHSTVPMHGGNDSSNAGRSQGTPYDTVINRRHSNRFLSNPRDRYLAGLIVVFVLALICIFVPKKCNNRLTLPTKTETQGNRPSKPNKPSRRHTTSKPTSNAAATTETQTPAATQGDQGSQGTGTQGNRPTPPVSTGTHGSNPTQSGTQHTQGAVQPQTADPHLPQASTPGNGHNDSSHGSNGEAASGPGLVNL